MERKLAAILSADVVGYSRLTALDEEGTLQALATYRRTISDFVAKHEGRIFGSAGDSVIAEFASAVQAVRCAVAIQRSLSRHSADLAEDRRLEFRIGINLGDVVVSGDDLLGDGVNVAARLQQIAAPSGVCVSGSIRDQIDGKVSFKMLHIGERSLKNIPRPVAVYRVEWQAEDPSETGVLGGTLTLPDKPSIAVLPFANMSGAPEQDYFADGITEDIITALSRHRWFFVIARNSSFTYKGRAVDVKQVARELGVRYVLEGSVRKAGDRVRVTGQLIDAETGAHLWAERYAPSCSAYGQPTRWWTTCRRRSNQCGRRCCGWGSPRKPHSPPTLRPRGRICASPRRCSRYSRWCRSGAARRDRPMSDRAPPARRRPAGCG